MELDIESNWLDYMVHCFYQLVTVGAVCYTAFCVYLVRRHAPRLAADTDRGSAAPAGAETKSAGAKAAGDDVVAAAVADLQALAADAGERDNAEPARIRAPTQQVAVAASPRPPAVTVDEAVSELIDVAEQARSRANVIAVATVEENLDTRPVVAVRPQPPAAQPIVHVREQQQHKVYKSEPPPPPRTEPPDDDDSRWRSSDAYRTPAESETQLLHKLANGGGRRDGAAATNRIRYVDSESEDEEEEEEDDEVALATAAARPSLKVTALQQSAGRPSGRRMVSEVTVQNVSGARANAAPAAPQVNVT